MKKMFKPMLLACGVVLGVASMPASAYVTLGNEYEAVGVEDVHSLDKILVFFSFNCPHCYTIEVKHGFQEKVLEKKPNQKFDLIPVPTGRFGYELSLAYNLAKKIGKEKEVFKPLFEAAQSGSILRINDIKNIVIEKTGISSKKYDEIMAYDLDLMVENDAKLIKKYEVNGLPTYVVGGLFRLKPNSIKAASENEFIDKYRDVAVDVANLIDDFK